MTVLTTEQRRAGLGATDMAAVVGLSPWATPIDVWQEKTGRAEPVEQTMAMRLGQLLEQPIADAYTEVTGRKLRKVSTVFHKEHSFLYCHPDRDVVGEDGLVEMKATQSPIRFADGTPPDVRAQVQFQMALKPRAWTDVVVLNGWRFDIYREEADLELQEWLIAEGVRFWQEHVLADTPPPVDGTKAYRRWLETVHPREEIEERVATPEEDVLLDGIRSARKAIKVHEDAKALLENQLAERMGAVGKLLASSASVTYRMQAASEYTVKREAKRVLRITFKKERTSG